MNKKYSILALALSGIFLTSCGKLDKESNGIDPALTTSNNTITTGRVDDGVYQALLEKGKYQVGIANDVETSRLNSNYNQNNFETGLLRLAKKEFPVDKYFFQEGQKIDGELLKEWLQRKSETNKKGLNPEDPKKGAGVQKILEYDFIDAKSKKIGGMVIGIALNQVDYSGDKPIPLSNEEIMAQGRQAANTVLTSLRQNPDLRKLPVYVGLFKQAKKEDVAGGNFMYGALSKGTATIDKWNKLEENHVLLPTKADNEATKDGLNTAFNEFKKKAISFFPNLTGVSGLAYYAEGDLVKLTIEIQSGYYTKPEIVSFTQFVAKTAEESFDKKIPWEITVNAVSGVQSYVVKNQGAEKPIAHIFN